MTKIDTNNMAYITLPPKIIKNQAGGILNSVSKKLYYEKDCVYCLSISINYINMERNLKKKEKWQYNKETIGV